MPRENCGMTTAASDGSTGPTFRLMYRSHSRISPARRKAELGEWLIRSTDGGKTWSTRLPTIFNSPHGPIQLRDGRLLYAGKKLWTDDKKIGVCESTDDGQTWRAPVYGADCARRVTPDD